MSIAGTGPVVTEAAPSDAVRSPVDVVRLVLAVVLVVVLVVSEWLFGDALAVFAAELFGGLSALPGWMVDVLAAGSRLLAVVLLVAGVVVVLRGGRGRAALTVASAGVAAAALAALVSSLQTVRAATAVPVGDGPLTDPSFPTVAGLAAVTGMVTAAAPWLPRRWRQAGWAAVFALAATRFLGNPVTFDVPTALSAGWLAGAAAVVVLGGPWRRPRGAAIVAGLAEIGVELVSLEQASLDARGSTPYFARTAAGEWLFVKALGDDERSGDLLFRLYRGVVPHDLGDERPFSSLRRAVEHEALVALTARSYQVRTPRLVAIARAAPHGFVLAYEAVDGRSLDRLEPQEVTDDLLAAVWCDVRDLHTHRIAHRDLRLANIFLGDDGHIWMIDFGFSELVASDVQLDTDVAELVASSSLQVGAERAVRVATRVAGTDTLHAALGRLRPWALSGASRGALAERPGLLDDLRRRIEAA